MSLKGHGLKIFKEIIYIVIVYISKMPYVYNYGAVRRVIAANKAVRRTNRRYARLPKSLKSNIRKIVRSTEETKYIDVTINITASAVSFGFQELLSVITQGDSRSNRQGSKITLVGMRYSLRVLNGDTFNVTRLLLLDRIIGGAINTSSAIPALEGPVNTDIYKAKFDFIDYTRMLPVDGSTAGQAGQSHFHRGYINCKNKVINYGTGSTPVTHNMGIQLHSDSTIIPNPGVTGYVRVYFKDA